MSKMTNICVAISLSLTVAGSTLADEPEEIRDANGRVIESVDENGVRVRYIYDRQGNTHATLIHLMMAPLDKLKQKADAAGVAVETHHLTTGLMEVLLQTYVDDRGTADPADDVERWKWGSLKVSLGYLLGGIAQAIPQDPAQRNAWANQKQLDMEHTLTSPELVFGLDILKAVATSSHKDVLNRAIGNNPPAWKSPS